MKKIILSLSIICNLGLIGYIFYTCKKTTSAQDQKIRGKKSKKSGSCKIAILTPVSHPSLEKIQQGFVDTMNKTSSLHCGFTVYNANGNKTLMRSQVEEIVQANFNLIFTIGAHATQMVKEVTTKKQKLIPIVFGAVSRPVELSLVYAESSSGNHLTGVSETNDYDKQLALLQTLKPQTKNVLLVYNPSQGAGLEKDKQQIEAVLKEKNITLKSIEVYNTNEIFGKVSPLLNDIDVLMVLKDNMVISGIDSLIKLCNQNNITLFATDLDSVDKGAVLGFGVHEYDFGANAALKARLIVEQKIEPSKIPVTPALNHKIKLNIKMMGNQGLVLSPTMMFIIQSSEVVK